MKAAGIFSVATMATAASAAPLLDDLVNTIEGVVGNVPVVADLLETVPATALVSGIFDRLDDDELVSALPIQDIVAGLPVQKIIAQLPVADIASGLPIAGDVVGDVAGDKKKRDVTESLNLPILGDLLDAIPASELLGGIIGSLSPQDLLSGLPVQKIVSALPVQDVIDRLPVKDVVAQLPIAGDVAQNLPVKRDLGTVPIVGALLQNIPALDLVNAVVQVLPVDGIVSTLPIDSIVARLPVKDLVAALPTDVVSNLHSKRDELNVVKHLETVVSSVQQHTKLINATITKVESGAIKKAEAQVTIVKQVGIVQVDLEDLLSMLNDQSAVTIASDQTDVVIGLLNGLVAELMATSQSLVSGVGLGSKLITPLHTVFGKSAKIVTVLDGFQPGILAGVAAGVGPLLTGLTGGLLTPLLAPVLSLVVGAVPI